MPHSKRYQKAKYITILGGVLNALLGIIKVVGGMLLHSHALTADGIHSFSDLLTDAMVLCASKYGSQDADHSHPYGHQRIETAATLLLALLLIVTGIGIAWDAIDEMIRHDHQMPGQLAVVIAALSILINEALFRYTLTIGKQIKSDLIIANAWHHRSDAASSLVVFVGLVGSLAGFVALDAFAAVIVGLMIVKMGWIYGWNSVKELVDSAVDPELRTQIELIIRQVDGVKKIHQLRSRMMGQDVFIDVHVLVRPDLSVSEGHYIAQHVHRALTGQISTIKDVTVHIDPEDDEVCCPSFHLPNRHTLEKLFLDKWRQTFNQITAITLHYLDGSIRIDIFCAPSFHEWDALSQRVNQDLASQPNIKTVRFFSQHLQETT